MKLEDFPGFTPPLWETDRRLTTVMHNDFAHACHVPASLSEHQALRARAIERVRLSAGLLPTPPAFTAQPRCWGEVVYEGVRIVKVDVETAPGLHLTGNLMLPEKHDGPLPGILSPHGHWPNGRIHHDARGSVIMRNFIFARLGFAVFCYDMIGKNDNCQIPHGLSAEAQLTGYLYGVSTFAMQTRNSLAAFDFLAEHPEVDANRIGCTGASGGASQTWFLALLQPRLKAIAPVCMLSAHFMGGCPCEEGPLLRTGGLTSFDILAAIAPMPMLVPSATLDWSSMVPTYEYPELKKVYALYHAEERLACFQLDAEHNYNQVTRERVYAWMVRQLQGRDVGETVPEEAIEPPPPELVLANCPPGQPSEESTKRALEAQKRFAIAGVLPDGETDLTAWRQERYGCLRQILSLEDNPKNVCDRVNSVPRFDTEKIKARMHILSNREKGDYIATLLLENKNGKKLPGVVVIPTDSHFDDFFNQGCYAGALDTLLERGRSVMLVQLCGSGFSRTMLKYSLRDEKHQLFFAFNPTQFAFRVSDLLTAVSMLHEKNAGPLTICATADTVKETAALLAIAPEKIAVALLEGDGLDDSAEAWMEKGCYQPLILRFGGVRGLLTMNDCTEIVVAGTGNFAADIPNCSRSEVSFEKQLSMF